MVLYYIVRNATSYHEFYQFWHESLAGPLAWFRGAGPQHVATSRSHRLVVRVRAFEGICKDYVGIFRNAQGLGFRILVMLLAAP